MMKPLVAAAVAAVLCTPEAAGQSIIQKSDWQAKSFETYLPSPAQAVPFPLHPILPAARVSSNTASDVRRM